MSSITSRGATKTLALTTFLSRIIGLFVILALEAAMSSSILWRTLRCELPTDMILQNKIQPFWQKKKITVMKLVPVSPKNFGIITAVKWTSQNKKICNNIPTQPK